MIIEVGGNTGKIIKEVSSNQLSTKTGIKNLQSRLDLIYNSSATFSLSEESNTVLAQITIKHSK